VKLGEIMEACRRLGLCMSPLRYRPRPIYLVETSTDYIDPNRTG
jgi:hypothetical protein